MRAYLVELAAFLCQAIVNPWASADQIEAPAAPPGWYSSKALIIILIINSDEKNLYPLFFPLIFRQSLADSDLLDFTCDSAALVGSTWAAESVGLEPNWLLVPAVVLSELEAALVAASSRAARRSIMSISINWSNLSSISSTVRSTLTIREAKLSLDS